MMSFLAASVASVLLLCISVAEADVTLSQDSLADTLQSLFPTVGNTSPRAGSVHSTSTRRRLLQFPLDKCLWNSDAAECEIGDVHLESLALMGQSSYAKFLRHQYSCIRKGRTADACNALTDCVWLQDELCVFVNFVDAYPKSPCIKKAPLTSLEVALLRRCPLRNSTKACSKLEGCSWSEQGKTCFSDADSIFFGIEQLEKQRNEVDPIKASALLESVLSNETFVTMDSYWNAFLDWQVPKTECPRGYDQLVCDYVDAYFARLLPIYFYCRMKFIETSIIPKDCNADPLCAYRPGSGECGQSLNVTFTSFEKADKKVLLPLIPAPNDRKIVKNSLICNRIPTASECIGKCQWVSSFGSCRLNPLQITQLILAGIEDPFEDPVCSYYQTVIDNQCADLYTGATCSANSNCQWFPKSNECGALPSTAAKTLIRQDPMLKRPYKRLAKSCSLYKTAKECSCAETAASDD